MDVEVSDSVALSRAVQLHVEGKLSQAVLETTPFPHLIIENFFPSDVVAVRHITPESRSTSTRMTASKLILAQCSSGRGSKNASWEASGLNP